jgi:UDP-glucose 4-epimerase
MTVPVCDTGAPDPRPWLVTGGAGFLGSRVVGLLLDRGIPAVALDSLGWGRVETLQRLARRPGCSVVIADIRDRGAVGSVFERFRPVVVVHLAAIHHIPTAVASPAETVGVNVLGTQVVLSAAIAQDLERFWFASTGDVYAPSSTAHAEDDPLAPMNVYGMTKQQGEQLVRLASISAPSSGFVIGRLFNLYGPGETNPHVLPELLGQLRASRDGPIRLGSLWPRRDFVPVDDAARAVVESALAASPGLTTLNIGSGRAVSMREAVTMVGELLGRPLRVERDPDRVRPVEREHLQADVSRLRALLGWAPHDDLRRGLTEWLRAEGLIP